MQHTRNPARNHAFMQMLLQTGMRISECIALRWHDIQLGERSGQATIRYGKGNRVRTVPLNESIRHSLAMYAAPRLNQPSTLKAIAAAWHTYPNADEPLWLSERATPLSAREASHCIQLAVQSLAARGLIPASTTAHSLRHTFATRYLARYPHDLVGLARLLGHTSIATTQIYVQPSATDMAERVEGIDINAYGA